MSRELYETIMDIVKCMMLERSVRVEIRCKGGGLSFVVCECEGEICRMCEFQDANRYITITNCAT